MSNLQENLTKIQNTVSELADEINKISINSGSGEVINCNTSFTEYPSILRDVINHSYGGIITVFAYKVSDIDPGTPEDSGNFDFDTNTYTPPFNGKKANELYANDADTVWMSQAMFARNNNIESTNSVLIDSGSKPIRISNIANIKALSTSQTVYLITKNSSVLNSPSGTNSSALTEGSIAEGGKEMYTGITQDSPYAFMSTRTKIDNKWSSYSKPALFAYYAKDGANGSDGVITRTVFAFKATASRDIRPDRPIGGKGNVSDNNIILPVGWYDNPNADENNKYSGVSNAIFSTDSPNNPSGTDPVCITGEDGIDGTDGQSSEFIYALFKSQTHADFFKTHLISNGYTLEVSQTDTVPNFIKDGQKIGTSLSIQIGDEDFNVQLTDSPIGISDEMKVELYGTRTKSSSKGNAWIGPMYWSVGGENGMDGDGVEYIFSVSNDKTPDNVPYTYAYLLENDPEEAEKFQKKEYIPTGGSDNDVEPDPNHPFLFCCSRKQYFNEELQKQMGSDFSYPKIGGHYGKDGNGSYTSFAFCISKNDLSDYSIIGGYYGDSLRNIITRNESGSIIDLEGYDSVPRVPSFDESIGMINKFFNNSSGEYDVEGFGPSKMTDSEHFQVEFNCPINGDLQSVYDGRPLLSLQEFKEIKEKDGVLYNSNEDLEFAGRTHVYNNGYGKWADGGSGAVYMATSRFINNKWEEGSVNKIQGEAGDTSQFIFKLTNGYKTPDDPNPSDTNGLFQSDDYKPSGGELESQSVSESFPVCWVSKRERKSGVGQRYSTPTQGSMYAKGNVHLELSENQINVPCESDGNIDKDYSDFIYIDLLLYDNGKLVTNALYSAIINDDDDDYAITTKLTEVPSSPSICGFLGNRLYIGRDFLSRYIKDSILKVECRVQYSATGDHINDGVPYTKSFIINKSTNTYELIPSHIILHTDKNGDFKDKILTVQAIKGVEDKFKTDNGGYIEYILNYSDGNSSTYGSFVDPGGMEYIYLHNYKNVDSIVLNYRLTETSEILTSETIGVVKDANDAVSKFLSQVFCRNNTDLSSIQPIGGTYDKPFPSPGGVAGEDGIPTYDSKNPQQLGMTQRGFSSDDPDGLSGSGSRPILMQDSNEVDIGGCDDEVLKYNNPGNPPENPGGYDGDTASGNNITTNPIGMAIRHFVNGSGTEWVVTRVKGEKGDTGAQGPPGPAGANGGFGPMARYSIGKKNAPSEYGDRSQASSEGYEGYDIVTHNEKYYLCNKKHASSSSPEPGSGSNWYEYGKESEHFEFLTADDAAITNLVAERLQAGKINAGMLLTNNPGGSQIKIENGLFNAYSDITKHPNLVIGVNSEKQVVLQIYDNDGKLLGELGSGGLLDKRDSSSTIKHFDNNYGYEVKFALNYAFSGDGYTDEFLQDVTVRRSGDSNSTLYIYQYTDITTSGSNVTTGDDHGKYFEQSSVNSPKASGVYLSHRKYYNANETLNDVVKSKINTFNNHADPGYRIDVSVGNNFKIYYSDYLYIENGAVNSEKSGTIYGREG